ncbi:MAG: nitroreductase family protein [Chloroflexi bacterium]|nr:nitroreductase family protein [Chloroflexota bacterium]
MVKDKSLRDKIVQIHRETRRHGRVIEETRVKELRHPGYGDPASDEPAGFKDAPVFIVVCADPRTLQATVLASNFYFGEGAPMATFLKNVGNATMLIHLAAASLGLGSQWVSVNNTWEGPVKELLGIPRVLGVHTIVPIGYPAYKVPPPYRRKLNEIVHYDGYDKSKFRTDEQISEFLVGLRQRTTPSYRV